MDQHPATDDSPLLSNDAFLGGMVQIMQPVKGHHRSGMDAVMLAASLPDHVTGSVLDFGAGAGAAGLCLAVRRPDLQIGLVEREPVLISAIQQTLALPGNTGLGLRVSVCSADITAPFAERRDKGLGADITDHIIMNPPYFERGTIRETTAAGRKAAHVFSASALDQWLRTAASCIRGDGTVTIVYRMDRLPALLAAIGNRFGSITVQPICPHADAPAHRLLLHAVKGGRGQFRMNPGVSLHDRGADAFQPWAEAINRRGEPFNCFTRAG